MGIFTIILYADSTLLPDISNLNICVATFVLNVVYTRQSNYNGLIPGL